MANLLRLLFGVFLLGTAVLLLVECRRVFKPSEGAEPEGIFAGALFLIISLALVAIACFVLWPPMQ